jgi:hypothetical protein
MKREQGRRKEEGNQLDQEAVDPAEDVEERLRLGLLGGDAGDDSGGTLGIERGFHHSLARAALQRVSASDVRGPSAAKDRKRSGRGGTEREVKEEKKGREEEGTRRKSGEEE